MSGIKCNPKSYEDGIKKIEEAIQKLEGLKAAVETIKNEAKPFNSNTAYINELKQDVGILKDIIEKNQAIYRKMKTLLNFAKTNVVKIEERMQEATAQNIE